MMTDVDMVTAWKLDHRYRLVRTAGLQRYTPVFHLLDITTNYTNKYTLCHIPEYNTYPIDADSVSMCSKCLRTLSNLICNGVIPKPAKWGNH